MLELWEVGRNFCAVFGGRGGGSWFVIFLVAMLFKVKEVLRPVVCGVRSSDWRTYGCVSQLL